MTPSEADAILGGAYISWLFDEDYPGKDGDAAFRLELAALIAKYKVYCIDGSFNLPEETK